MKRHAWCLGMVLLLSAGCATVTNDPRATQTMLEAAGFQVKTADTPEKRASLEGLTPHTLIRRERDGQTYYVDADPDACRCLYIGTDAQYQPYRKLAWQRTSAAEEALVDQHASETDLWTPWP